MRTVAFDFSIFLAPFSITLLSYFVLRARMRMKRQKRTHYHKDKNFFHSDLSIQHQFSLHVCGRNGDRNTAVASARASVASLKPMRVKKTEYNIALVRVKETAVCVAKSASSRVDDALYNREQGFYVPTLIHSRRLGVN